MKPSDVTISSSIYNFANDARSGEIILNIPSGTRADLYNGGLFEGYATFSLGRAEAEYMGQIYESKSGKWAPVLATEMMLQVEQVTGSSSYGPFARRVMAQIYRVSGNTYRCALFMGDLRGELPSAPGQDVCILREDVQVRFRVKTFLQPLASS